MTMTSQVSKAEAEALAEYLHAVRPTWDVPGIMVALQETVKTRRWLTLDRLAAVGTRAAKNPKARTPAVIALEGRHWHDPSPVAAPRTSRPSCPEHGGDTVRTDGTFGCCHSEERVAAPGPSELSRQQRRADPHPLRKALGRAQDVPTPTRTAGQSNASGYEIRGSVA